MAQCWVGDNESNPRHCFSRPRKVRTGFTGSLLAIRADCRNIEAHHSTPTASEAGPCGWQCVRMKKYLAGNCQLGGVCSASPDMLATLRATNKDHVGREFRGAGIDVSRDGPLGPAQGFHCA